MNSKKGFSGGLIIAVIVLAALALMNKMIIWWILGLIAFLIGAVIVMLFIMNSKEKKKKQEFVTEGITLGDVDEIISKSTLKLQNIRRAYYKLDDLQMREELDLISDKCKQIFKIVKEDSKDIKAARRFLTTMLTSLENIINQSVQLFEAPNLTEDGKKALTNAKEGMILLRQAADEQINKFYQNNILDLDVELEVLKKTLSARGLLDDDTKNEKEIKQNQ